MKEKRYRTRRGFTIVELLMVIGILGVLMGIVTTAAASSIRSARSQKADALCTMVEQGIATYYAQYGKWPGGVNAESIQSNVSDDATTYHFSASEVKAIVTDLVMESKKGNPMMDISGLFVSRQSGEKDDRNSGLDFMEAIHGTKKSPTKMKVAEMNFGYPETEHGYFRRFDIYYSIPTDEIKVKKQ